MICDRLADIRCSEKCTSGYIKKRISNFKERFSYTMNITTVQKTSLADRGRQILRQLRTAPAQKRNKKSPYDNECIAYGFALRFYFEDHKEKAIRYKLINNHNSDESMGDMVKRRLELFRCVKDLRGDESYHAYLKYLVKSWLTLVKDNDKDAKGGKDTKKNESGDTKDDKKRKKRTKDSDNESSDDDDDEDKIDANDLTQLLYPYMEMYDTYDRTIPSHSYLGYMFKHAKKVFPDKEKKCPNDDKKKKKKGKGKNNSKGGGDGGGGGSDSTKEEKKTEEKK